MRDDDLTSVLQAVLKPDGAVRTLRWLARRFDAHAVLLDLAGRPELAFPDHPSEVLSDAAADIRRVAGGEFSAASVQGPSWWAQLARAGGYPGGGVLLVAAHAPFGPEDGALIAHAAALLRLRRSADWCEKATADIRETVLHLLMSGQVTAARRVASVMRPALPDMVRVYVAEGPPAQRETIAGLFETACNGDAWIVMCPVYRPHLIILSFALEGQGADDAIADCLRAAGANAAVGASDIVPLRDTATGYEQACHALAVARHRQDPWAWFTQDADIAAVLGPGARRWARQALAPLLDYKPPRPQDPDSSELCTTLLSWLDFRVAAWRQLKIHRNTLQDRVRRIQAIVGRDLSRTQVQAELHLALRLLNRAGDDTADSVPGLGELLARPAAVSWARLTLAPLRREVGSPLLDTVRAWLAADTRLEATAAALGITARAVRQRLARAEQCLGRSLLGGPSARHDLLMALRIQDSAASIDLPAVSNSATGDPRFRIIQPVRELLILR